MSCFESELMGSMNEQGQHFGFLLIGLTFMIKDVLVHHVVLIVLSNNIDLPWVCFFIFSLSWLFMIGAIEDANPMSKYFRSFYDVLLQQPLFWMIFLAALALAIVPIYSWLKYRQFFGGDPRYDLAYRRKVQMKKPQVYQQSSPSKSII